MVHSSKLELVHSSKLAAGTPLQVSSWSNTTKISSWYTPPSSQVVQSTNLAACPLS
ncbi:hypothetical protein Bpfe_001335, partial [Biomphalaria pfeifferi]